MDRNDDNKDIIREARQKAKNEKEPKKNLTADEKDTKEEVKEKIVNDEELKDKKTNKNKIYIGMICFFVLIGIMYFSAKRYDNLVYPNIYLYEEDVSKLNKEKLNDKIDILINDINKKLITISPIMNAIIYSIGLASKILFFCGTSITLFNNVFM